MTTRASAETTNPPATAAATRPAPGVEVGERGQLPSDPVEQGQVGEQGDEAEQDERRGPRGKPEEGGQGGEEEKALG